MKHQDSFDRSKESPLGGDWEELPDNQTEMLEIPIFQLETEPIPKYIKALLKSGDLVRLEQTSQGHCWYVNGVKIVEPVGDELLKK